jgi:lantibiotic transport system permease protein
MNFIYCFQSEWMKKRRSLASWLIVAGAFFTPLIITLAKLVRRKLLAAEVQLDNFWQLHWNSCWESMAIFLLPIGVILTASLLIQLEYKNNTWKQLHTTPQRLTTIFFAKMAVIVVMILQFFILFNIGIFLSAIIPCWLTGTPLPKAPIPFAAFLGDNVRYFIDCLPIIALQYLLCLQFKNFLVAIGVGILLWILSIAVLSWQYGYLIPYTYCSLNYLNSQAKALRGVNIHAWAMGYFVLFTIASYLLYINKKEKG